MNQPVTDPASDMFTFDADAHILEPRDMWENYLENEFKDRAIKFRVNDKGVEQLFADNQVILPNCTAALGGVNIDRTEAFNPYSGLTYLDGAPSGSMDGAERLVQFDDWGLSAGLVLPTIGILWDSDDNNLANAYCRAYNNWLYDFQAADRNRLVVAANLNFHDIDEAVKELDVRLKQGFKGVFLPPERVDGHAFTSDYFDPLWARIEEAGVPLLMHVIVRSRRFVTGFVGDWYETPANRTFSFALGAPSQVMPACMAMVMDGLFDKFPKLKVVAIEAGCGWAPYAMDRLDEKYQHFSGFDLKLNLDKPSDYFRRNLWFVAEPEERTIGAALELVGEDRILWGSDFPHIDSHIDAASQVKGNVSHLPEHLQRAVLGDNARKLFAL
ncbi:MAG: amidohydrolase [Porticoccaceae bacterium]|nr:amidohydrolase [Porticoccaceae bacterium]